MLLPLAVFMPGLYWTLRQAAIMRHIMLGVYDTPWHYRSMRAVYGV